jgi:hypothetical protein
LLDRIYIRFDNSNHTLQSADTEIVFLITSLFLNSLNSVLLETDTGNFPFRQKPYLQTSYTEVISRSSGLRAPPFCWLLLLFSSHCISGFTLICVSRKI